MRGLQACSTDPGILTLLALDHRQNLRRELRPTDPASVTYREMVEFKGAVVRALAPALTGILLDPEIGAAQAVSAGALSGHVGLVVALEATSYLGASTARTSRVLEGWSVEQAKRMGASAVKLLVYYHPEAATADAQERLVAQVGEACRRTDLPLFLEPLSYSIDEAVPKLTGETRRHVVVRTAERLTPLFDGILKAEFPYDPTVDDPNRWREACEELSAASQRPWVLLSGGVDARVFEAQVEVACDAGACGVLAGRAVWAEAAQMSPIKRDTFLCTTSRDRLARLQAIVASHGRPWSALAVAAQPLEHPGEGWYRGY